MTETTNEVETISQKEAAKVIALAKKEIQELSSVAKKILSEDKVYLVLHQDYFARIVNRVKVNISTDVPIAAVNVINSTMNLYINPVRYPKFEKRERIAVLIHEVLHLALGHIFRREDKDAYLWNLATDCIINQLIPSNDSVSLPENCILPSSFLPDIIMPPNLSAEEYYDILTRNKEKIPPQLQPEPGSGEGEIEDWHKKWDESEGNEKINEAAIKKEIKKAYQTSKMMGKVPANIMPHIEDYIESKINWRSKLRMFPAKHIQNGVKSTWKRESRRMGGMAKGKKKNKKLHICVMVDTSGSVTEEELAQFSGEILSMWRTGAKITIMECDADIHGVYEFKGKIKNLKYEGRGGTSFIPPFEKIEREKLQFDCAIYLTDGGGYAPDKVKIPTLWVITPTGVKPKNTQGKELNWGSFLWIN